MIIEESNTARVARKLYPGMLLSSFGNLSHTSIFYYHTGLWYESGHTHIDLIEKSIKSPGLDLNQRSLPYQDNALPN
jgi:hypothetical protein